jgi:hypothetical protein
LTHRSICAYVENDIANVSGHSSQQA